MRWHQTLDPESGTKSRYRVINQSSPHATIMIIIGVYLCNPHAADVRVGNESMQSPHCLFELYPVVVGNVTQRKLSTVDKIDVQMQVNVIHSCCQPF